MPRDSGSSSPFSSAEHWSFLLGSLGHPVGLVDTSALEADWRTWLTTLLPRWLRRPGTETIDPFGEHHQAFWEWVWALRRGVAPIPFVGIWPRGGAKSTSAELAGAMAGALRTRRYCLYICEKQERAEDHVGSVAAMFESDAMARYYPHVANRGVTKYGNSKGWERSRLTCAGGYVVDAIGFDSAARGAKIEDARPDLMIFDDIEGDTRNPELIARKVRDLTNKFLPAGSNDLAVLFIQNLIHIDSICSMLAGISEKKADFLQPRIVSGPFPAVHDLTYAPRPDGGYQVTGGRPIWAGMNLDDVQGMIDRFGLTAFLIESQQEVDVAEGGMFSHLDFRHCTPAEVPDLVRSCVWVDPAVTEKDDSDSHAIQADGLAADGTIYRLWSWEQRSSPEKSLCLAIAKAAEIGADHVGVETDQGGDTWKALYKRLVADMQGGGVTIEGVTYTLPKGTRPPAFAEAKAGAGYGPKTHRASQMLTDYERGIFIHVTGTHTTLERSLRRFPKVKPYDLVDAAGWSWRDLAGKLRVQTAGVTPHVVTRFSPYAAMR